VAFILATEKIARACCGWFLRLIFERMGPGRAQGAARQAVFSLERVYLLRSRSNCTAAQGLWRWESVFSGRKMGRPAAEMDAVSGNHAVFRGSVQHLRGVFPVRFGADRCEGPDESKSPFGVSNTSDRVE
jgi:hypothetical protein